MKATSRAASFALFFSAAAALVAIARCGPSHERTEVDEREDFSTTCVDGSVCGTFRWEIKTTVDQANGQIGAAPADFTIPQLLALAAPANVEIGTQRFTNPPYAVELKTVRLRDVLLQRYKLESDSDIHMMISDPSDPGGTSVTMIAELAKPCCVFGSSPFSNQLTAARAAFEARYTPIGTYTVLSPAQVISILGVGFYDMPNHGSGGATNGIELHPVIALCFGKGCALPGDATSGGSHSIGGTISGLAGSGLQLRNGADVLSPSAGATSFSFPTKVASGGTYAVTIDHQPGSPDQTCTLANGAGTVGSFDISVAIDCVTNQGPSGGPSDGGADAGSCPAGQHLFGGSCVPNVNPSRASGGCSSAGELSWAGILLLAAALRRRRD